DSSPKLELKLRLSPPRDHWSSSSSSRMGGDEVVSLMEISPENSCLSRETSPDRGGETNSSMVLVGCPRCLMYVMLLGSDPKCPKCKSTVLLDFMREDRAR
ncbi:hypothetical protein M569_05993, partial [Genlisea aurea]